MNCMKRVYLSKIAGPLALFLGCAVSALAQPLTPVTYNYTGGVQSYTVPGGVNSIAVDMIGAKGGNSYTGSVGGNGGRVQCTLATTPGQILFIVVGGAGTTAPNTATSTLLAGGYNGGGDRLFGYAGSGGGATDIRTVSNNLATRVVVAGGGAAGGYSSGNNSQGGAGGGLTGGNGNYVGGNQILYGGVGGSQTAGGAGSTNGPGSPGAFLTGGNGPTGYYGGPGGGGWYGGGGGYYGGGGGGSSYTNSLVVTPASVTHVQGDATATGNGQVTIIGNCTPPTAGAITGFPAGGICVGGVAALSNPTGSTGGVWSSGNTAIANMTNLGFVTGVAPGTANVSYTVTYACGTPQTAVFTVTVNPQPVIAGPASICVGSTYTLGGSSTPVGSPAGTWTSGNNFQATIDLNTGVLTGNAPGNPSITYTLATGCRAVFVGTVNSLPAAITGTPSTCLGLVSSLRDGSVGGAWSATSLASINIAPNGDVLGTSVGNTTITYTIPSTGCYVTTPFTVNPLPTPFNLLMNPGTGTICAGDPGVNLSTNVSDPSTNYQLYRGTTMVGLPLGGSPASFGLDYHLITVAGTYSVLATNSFGCTMPSSANAVISVNPLPNSTYSINSGGGYCVGASGVQLTLSSSDAGVRYDLYGPGSSLPITSITSTTSGALVDFSTQSLPSGYSSGTYYVKAVDANNCTSTMAGTATIALNPLPDVHNLTARNGSTLVPGDGFCQGDPNGVRIGVDFSNSGVDYHLVYGSNTIATVAGASSSLAFPNQTGLGAYTIVAENSTTHCTSNVTGTANVHYSHVPDVHVVKGGGNYCSYDTGVHIWLDASDAGVNYQLYHGLATIGMPVAGAGVLGDSLDLGLETLNGSYSVRATELATGCVSNMTGSATVTIDAIPAIHSLSAANGGNFCTGAAGQHITLNLSESNVSYELFMNGSTSIMTATGNSNILDFGVYNTPGNYTVIATNQSATHCVANMSGVAVITENLLPTAYPLTGGGAYCTGTPAPHVGLSFSNIGVSYQLFFNNVAQGAALTGSSSSLDFGIKATSGNYTIVGTNLATGCSVAMSGSETVTEKTPPLIYTVTSNGSAYCAGDTGLIISLIGSEAGIDYKLYNNGVATGNVVTGTGMDIDFGLQTAAGLYTVIATNGANSCDKQMNSSANITIYPLPLVYPVTGDGSFCAGGTGVHVMQANSVVGVNYQLYNNNVPVGMPVAGTGSPLDYGAMTTGGYYTAVATDAFTTCMNNMSGSATVIVNPLPGDHNVSGGGDYCVGGAGFHIALDGTDAGMSYQLYNSSTAAGLAVTGDGSPKDFGIITAAGTYKVVATDQATGCDATMTGNPVINILPLPDVFSVYGGGGYCIGGSGVHITLGGSTPGANYQLYNGITAVGTPQSATGSVIDFGAFTGAGHYSVVATDASGVCSSNMSGTATVAINPLPIDYSVTGGGNYCAGGTGATIGLTGSTAGVTYDLYNGSTWAASVAGAGIVRYFAPQTAAGTYTVRATNTTTGCMANMSGTATVGVLPNVTPSVNFSASLGDTVCAGAVNTFTAADVNGGTAPDYQWTVNGVFAGAGNVFSYVPALGDVVQVTMTSNAVCPLPAMVSSTHLMMVRAYVTPAATITSTPGDVVCQGTPVSYASSTIYGGASPTYTWLKNGLIVSTGNTYSTVPVNGDVLIMVLGSNFPCRLADTVYSNNIYMQVDSPTTPVINIKAMPGSSIGIGQSDTLKATVSYGGTSPLYQWLRNGMPIPGATSDTYISNSFVNRDSITCMVTTHNACAANTSFNSVVISVRGVGVNQLAAGTDINVVPNPNKGAFAIKGNLASGIDEEVSYELTNMLGQVVYRNSFVAHSGVVNEQVQTNGTLAAGTYLLHVHSGSEKAIFHLIIE